MVEVDTLVGDALGSDVKEPETEPEERAGGMHVCTVMVDGKVCGADFDSKVKLNGHTMAKHQVTWDGKPVARGGRKAKDTTDQKPSTAAKKSAKAATSHVEPRLTDATRAGTYTQSLATVGLLAHMAAGRVFDDYDLTVWTNGTPGLANALDAVGQQNDGVRRVCDLLLAGGTGGAYVQLVLATAMIAVPIAAHHGWLPETTGQRFGAFIGVAAEKSGQEVVDAPAPPSDRTTKTGLVNDPTQWSYEEWVDVLNQMPPHVVGGIMEQMTNPTGAMGPTIPPMPGTEPFTIPEDQHRGSVGTNGEPASDESVPQP